MRGPLHGASIRRHSLSMLAEALLVAAILSLLALAFSPVSRPAEQLAGVEPVAARGNAVITVADGVFAGTSTATVNPGGDAWVRARCYQAGTRVYEQYVRVDANNQAVLTLGPTPSWTRGSADCTAEELSLTSKGRWQVLAKTVFYVSG
jgi:hypothetical protein